MELPNTAAQWEAPSLCQPAASRLQLRTQHTSCPSPVLQANSSRIRRCQTVGTTSVRAPGHGLSSALLHSLKVRGTMGLARGRGVRGGMSVGTVDERLRQTWQKCCLQGAQSQWTSAPGQAPCLAQSHVPWVCCRCCYHPGEGDGKGGLRGPTPAPLPKSGSGQLLP